MEYVEYFSSDDGAGRAVGQFSHILSELEISSCVEQGKKRTVLLFSKWLYTDGVSWRLSCFKEK